MPISEDHFTSVPIVATIKMVRSVLNEDDDDTWDENDVDYARQYPCLHLKNSFSLPQA